MKNKINLEILLQTENIEKILEQRLKDSFCCQPAKSLKM